MRVKETVEGPSRPQQPRLMHNRKTSVTAARPRGGEPFRAVRARDGFKTCIRKTIPQNLDRNHNASPKPPHLARRPASPRATTRASGAPAPPPMEHPPSGSFASGAPSTFQPPFAVAVIRQTDAPKSLLGREWRKSAGDPRRGGPRGRPGGGRARGASGAAAPARPPPSSRAAVKGG